VRTQIAASLEDLHAIRGLDLGPIHTSVVGAMCTGAPTCALVVCGYGTQGWSPTPGHDVVARELVHS
jgi:hypothetical protein